MEKQQQSIGERIRLVRGDKKQSDFAATMGINVTTLSRYETNKRTPDGDFLAEFSRLTGANPAWLLTGEGPVWRSDRGSTAPKRKHDSPEEGLPVHMPSGFGQRLKRLRKDFGKSRNDFSEELGIGLNSLVRYENEKRYPDSDLLMRWCHKFQVNPSWLLLDIGPMYLNEPGPVDGDDIEYLEPQTGYTRHGDDMILVPRLQARPAAGERNGKGEEDEFVEGVVSFKEYWIRNEMKLDAKALSVVVVEGDSMEPTLRPGDRVLVDHRQRTVTQPGIYVIRLDDSLLIKRLKPVSNHKLLIISDNDLYPSDEVSRDNEGLRVIGRVVWVGKRV